jgi:hypothetical protein
MSSGCKLWGGYVDIGLFKVKLILQHEPFHFSFLIWLFIDFFLARLQSEGKPSFCPMHTD